MTTKKKGKKENKNKTQNKSAKIKTQKIKQKHNTKAHKINLKEKSKAKTNDKKFSTITIILIFLILAGMVAAIIIIRNNHTEKKTTYNGFMFFQGTRNHWFTYLQNKNGNVIKTNLISYFPTELEDIPVEGSPIPVLRSMFLEKKAYITFDPEQKQMGNLALAALELSVSMKQILGVTPIAACTKNVTGCEDRAIITCENTNKPTVFLTYGNETKVTQKNNCLIIEGEQKELIKATDRVIYTWYGVMK